jgi:pyrroloquinoline quinone biosynthesis protein D
MAASLDATLVPRLQVGVRLRYDRHSGRYLLLSPERGLLLNESAAQIARGCDGKRPIHELVLGLVDAGVSEQRAHEQVCGLLSELVARGLIGLQARP